MESCGTPIMEETPICKSLKLKLKHQIWVDKRTMLAYNKDNECIGKAVFFNGQVTVHPLQK